MSKVNKMIETIELMHKETICLFKMGNFYRVYGRDAYILSYLFNYKIIEKENVPACSFPITSLSKVENGLEKNKINYIVVDKRSNYELEQKNINKQENNYERIFEKSKEPISAMLRIQKVYNFLMNSRSQKSIFKRLDEIEKVLKNG